MSFSTRFITRPIATLFLTVAVVLCGGIAYGLLPLATLPQVDFPTIQVFAALPGASAETVGATLAAPLEQAFQRIPGLTEMTSASSLGRTSITLQFDLSRSIDAAALDVQGAINAAGGLLPKALPNPPTYSKVNPATFKILTIALTSDTLPLRVLDQYADTFFVRELSMIEGVGLVDLNGEQKPAIRVQINPAAAAAMGITLEDVRAAIGAATINGPKGTFNNNLTSSTLDANDQILDAVTAGGLIVANHQGAPVRIRDIGRAVDGVENVQIAGWFQGKRAVLVDLHPQPGANLVATVDRVRAALPDLERRLPPAINITVVGDRSLTIRAAIADMQFTLCLTVGLVVLVIFLFLRNIWATIIPSIAIPVSLLGAFGAMYLLNYSLDNLSFMGLTVAVGFVVDDAIVMIENIMRHIEKGEDRLTAAITGAREISFTIISMTVSLIAVFIPILLMSGVIGRIFREFAVTVAASLLVSAAVSLTLTPMMCGHLIRPAGRFQISWLGRSMERVLDGGQELYRRSLRWTLAHAPHMLGFAAATLIATLGLFALVPKGFFPQQDTGIATISTEAGQDISFSAMTQRQAELAAAIGQDPEIDSVLSFMEASQLNTGRIYAQLIPFADRRSSMEAVMERLRRRATQVSGISAAIQPVQDMQIGARRSRFQYQYTLQDSDLDELYSWAPKLLDMLRSLPEIKEAATDLQIEAPRDVLAVDRDTASRLGVTQAEIDETLYDAFGQRQVATLFTPLAQYHIVLEVDPAFQQDAEALGYIHVRSAAGPLVPLSAFAKVGRTVAPLTVNHQGQFPAVTLSFDLAPGVALGDAVTAIQRARSELGVPAGLQASFQGVAQAFQASLASQPYLILAAIVAVYLVLGILYESMVHPLTILSTLPSAGVGALLALMLTGNQLDVMSLVGLILLIGIVKKNAIMMVDFAVSAQRAGQTDPVEVIYQAAVTRFRPIMMTTMTALLGTIPLALGHGIGAELRRPLGIAVVGGLLLSQLLTLYTTPVIFLYLERFRKR